MRQRILGVSKTTPVAICVKWSKLSTVSLNMWSLKNNIYWGKINAPERLEQRSCPTNPPVRKPVVQIIAVPATSCLRRRMISDIILCNHWWRNHILMRPRFNLNGFVPFQPYWKPGEKWENAELGSFKTNCFCCSFCQRTIVVFFQRTWAEVDYVLDVCMPTNGVHIQTYQCINNTLLVSL